MRAFPHNLLTFADENRFENCLCWSLVLLAHSINAATHRHLLTEGGPRWARSKCTTSLTKELYWRAIEAITVGEKVC